MTHFTASNLLDLTTTALAVNAFPAIAEKGLLAQSADNWPLIMSFKVLVVSFLLSSYALETNGSFKKLAFIAEKAMQITTPAVYLVSAWNLLQIGLEIFGE